MKLAKIGNIQLFQWGNSSANLRNLPFLLTHLSPFILFFTDFHWNFPVFAILLCYFRLIAISAFNHRYFSHRSYEIRSRLFQFIVALWGATAGQNGPLWWTASHRYHHLHSDTKKDPHSPQNKGFWYSHIFWITSDKRNWLSPDKKTKELSYYPSDLAKYPELVFLESFANLPTIILGGLAYLVYDLGWGWGLNGLVWYLISNAMLYHLTFSLASFAHIYGSQRFSSGDNSRNNPLVALLTLGEGWHNNHHANPSNPNFGVAWYEFDFVYYFLCFLEKCSLIHNLKKIND